MYAGFCHQEAELKGRVCRRVKISPAGQGRALQQLFNEAHLEVFGMTNRAKTLAVGVAAQQLTMDDWERFDEPTVMRRATRT